MLKQIAGLKKHLNSSLSDMHLALTFCPGPFLAHPNDLVMRWVHE